MEENKAHILIEDNGEDVRLDIVGSREQCEYMIAHYYISYSEFRGVVNEALKSVMQMGINLLKKDIGNGD